MKLPSESSEPQPTWYAWVRPIALLMVIGVITTMGVATQLTPSPDGVGTHQQLGLAPCSMRLMFGLRCPGCGMTTSWAHFVRLQWYQSLAANPAGLMLAIFSVVVAAIASRVAYTGRLPSVATQTGLTVAAVAIVAVTFLHWIYRIW